MVSVSQTIYVNLAFEDDLSEAVLHRLLGASGRPYQVSTSYSGGGYAYLKERIHAFNSASKVIPFVVLADLDRVECAPTLMSEWLARPKHPNFLFRVAVREVESWLLAHRSGLAKFLSIQVDLIPQDYDNTVDPKRTLLDMARKSPNKELRRDLIPREGSTSQQGPNYNLRMAHFVDKYWDPHVAAEHSPSLRGAIDSLVGFVPVCEAE